VLRCVSADCRAGYDDVYHSGVGNGDPNLCSKETGAALVDQLTAVVARFAAHFATRVG
jgi:creatinine amidohydrolase